MKRIGMGELLASRDQLAALRELLGCDGLAAIPTETFYALAASPFSPKAVAALFEVKGRPAEKALPVLFAGRDQLDRFGIAASPEVLDRFTALWPAPLTVIFETKTALPCAGGDHSLAVREPAHEELRRLLRETGPLTGTSANPSGMPPLSDPNEVALAFGEKIDLLVDGGASPGIRPSTLIDARFDPPRLLREGAFPWPPK
jgi:L-threonylcarbamoyladenylate synthase